MSKISSNEDLPEILCPLAYTSKSLGLAPNLTVALVVCGGKVPFRTASSVIQRARRLMKTERPTISIEIVSKRSSVAEGGDQQQFQVAIWNFSLGVRTEECIKIKIRHLVVWGADYSQSG